MSGSVELDQDGTSLLIRFPYREDLVALVKDLPGRRWDPRQKVWRVPAANVEQVYLVLSRHLFDFAPEIPSLLAGTLGTPAAAPAKAPRPAEPGQRKLPLPGHEPAEGSNDATETPPALSIAQLNTLVRDGLRRQFAEAFWVVGEVVDYDKSAGRQHRFFQLAEKANDQPRALAVVEVAMFANTAERLQQKFGSGDDAFTLRDGIEVRVLVKVDFYVASGRFQIIVQDIDPSFTLGKLALTREQILRELAQKGLATRNRGLGLAVPALRLGVLSSPDSDGWNDFLRQLQESQFGFEVTLVPIKVQGQELKPSLLAGLSWFARQAADFDVLCIVRGGGSRTDLAWFDDRDVAFAVAQHPLKILVGIGHQRDQSVLDAIAHSEKTPTAVAAFLVSLAEDARAEVEERARRLHDAVSSHLAQQRERLAELARDVVRATEHHLQRQHRSLAHAGRGLQAATMLRLSRDKGALQAAAARIRFGVQRQFERATARLDQRTTRQRLLDPARVLGRGYALVRSPDGRVLPSATRLHKDQTVVVQFRDGRATTRVTDITTESP
jgi:exodeoxyribonuclease VII large subunit